MGFPKEKNKMEIGKLTQKHAFWEALVITIFIFGIGILFGVFLENSRAEKVSEMYLNSEINLLDVQVQSELLNLENINCQLTEQKNIEFGDKIYEDAKKLDRLEASNRFSDDLKLQHRRFDILRTLFWLNSIKIREKCNLTFHTVIYLYNYAPDSVEQKSKQSVFSTFLSELKNKHGNNIILIPIAKNLNLASLDLMLDKYKIQDVAVVVDEELVVSNFEDFEKIKQAVSN